MPLKNKEKKREYNKRYYQEHKEERKKQAHERYLAKREEILKQQHKYEEYRLASENTNTV